MFLFLRVCVCVCVCADYLSLWALHRFPPGLCLFSFYLSRTHSCEALCVRAEWPFCIVQQRHPYLAKHTLATLHGGGLTVHRWCYQPSCGSRQGWGVIPQLSTEWREVWRKGWTRTEQLFVAGHNTSGLKRKIRLGYEAATYSFSFSLLFPFMFQSPSISLKYNHFIFIYYLLYLDSHVIFTSISVIIYK